MISSLKYATGVPGSSPFTVETWCLPGWLCTTVKQIWDKCPCVNYLSPPPHTLSDLHFIISSFFLTSFRHPPHLTWPLCWLSYLHTILPLFPHPPHLTWPLLTVLSTHYPAPGFVSSSSSSLGGILQNSLSSVPFPMTGLDISTVCKACLCSFILGSPYSKIWCLLGHLLVLNASQEVKVLFM